MEFSKMVDSRGQPQGVGKTERKNLRILALGEP